jgi:hypothetical protein
MIALVAALLHCQCLHVCQGQRFFFIARNLIYSEGNVVSSFSLLKAIIKALYRNVSFYVAALLSVQYNI